MNLSAEAGRDFSIVGLFLHADIVVQSIMVGLVICSIVSWAMMLEKFWRIMALRNEVRQLEGAAPSGLLPQQKSATGLIAAVNSAADEEWASAPKGQSVGELRDRLELAMRSAMRQQLKRVEAGAPFLATLGSAAPFIGLFGTVWGIMNSFTAIAQSKDTSLAVVAPGIAEALFATAIGLAAAIPAVIAYNQIAVSLGRVSDRVSVAISALARGLAQRGTQGAA